jgi:hypothetical protein
VKNNETPSNIQVMTFVPIQHISNQKKKNVCFRQLCIQAFEIAHSERNRAIRNTHTTTIKHEWLLSMRLQCHHTCSNVSLIYPCCVWEVFFSWYNANYVRASNGQEGHIKLTVDVITSKYFRIFVIKVWQWFAAGR